MLGRRKIETRYRLRLNLFSLVLIDGIMVGVIAYAILAFYSPENSMPMDESLKIIIIIGLVLALLILGVALPLRRYFKRKEEGTLPPIRLPEEPEVPEDDENEPADDGPMTIEQQINAMTKELDEGENTDDKE